MIMFPLTIYQHLFLHIFFNNSCKQLMQENAQIISTWRTFIHGRINRGSQRNSSINHEVIELVDKIADATENNEHVTIGIFYFLISRKHLTRYVIINNCLKVDLYLARRKQFVKCNVDERKYLYNVESRKHLLLVPYYS